MNILIRLMTVSLLISALAFGMAGYAVSRTKGAPPGYVIEELRGSCADMLQDIKTLAGDLPAPGLADPYYGAIDFPFPIACAGENLRPF